MKSEDNDLTCFCKHCGTELFFLDRFPTKDSSIENIRKDVQGTTMTKQLKVLFMKHYQLQPAITSSSQQQLKPEMKHKTSLMH